MCFRSVRVIASSTRCRSFTRSGLTAGTLIPLVSGARLVMYTSPLHFKVVPEMVREKRCSVMFGTSTFLHHYARHARADDFKTMKIVVAGAEKLADSVRKPGANVSASTFWKAMASPKPRRFWRSTCLARIARVRSDA
jgi:hypothetical protein